MNQIRTPKEIKKIPLEQWTNLDFEILEREGIINGVGNNVLPKWMRFLMTQLFFYLDFKIHDANYWLAEDLPYKEREKARKRADFGLLKYSWHSPIGFIEKFSLSGIVIKDILNIILTTVCFLIALIPCVFVAIPAYIAVRFGGKNSFKN